MFGRRAAICRSLARRHTNISGATAIGCSFENLSFQMDDRVEGEHPNGVDEKGKKQSRWRGRLAMAVFVLTVLIGYALIFWAFNLWYKG